MPRPTKRPDVPATFQPQFIDRLDHRNAMVRALEARKKQLMSDTGADSYQKRLLVERAIFLSIILETSEATALETGEFDVGKYVQGCNALLGLLKHLGLERHQRQAELSLAEYTAKARKKSKK